MPSIRPLLFALTLLWTTAMLIRAGVRRLHPEWLAFRGVRAGLRVLPWLAVAWVGLWSLGTFAELRPVALLGAVLAVLTFIAQLSLLISIPLAAVVRGGLVRLWPFPHPRQAPEAPGQTPAATAVPEPAQISDPGTVTGHAAPLALQPESPVPSSPVRAPAGPLLPESQRLVQPGPPPGVSRRRFIELATGAVPVAALASSGSGVLMAAQPQAMPIIELHFVDLPPALEGLKILHISDVHLGMFVTVADVAAAMTRAAAHAPDLVLLTGDVADDLKLLRPALDEVMALKPRLGAYASIGNHEYFRGFEEARRIYDRGPIPLLLEANTVIPVGDARIALGGVNDPVHLRGNHSEFMKNTYEKTLNGAPSDAFQLIMSHRPGGFLESAARGIHLTLSGHTHGGQLGHNGRSVFEPLSPEGFLWGPYQRGKSRLYTSSGFGHWMPVRVGCPAEAPIIVLKRG